MPGCLPETEPQSFDEWSDARQFLVSELNLWLDQEAQTEVPSENEMQIIRTWRDLANGNYEDDLYKSRVTAGYVFWIQRA